MFSNMTIKVIPTEDDMEDQVMVEVNDIDDGFHQFMVIKGMA